MVLTKVVVPEPFTGIEIVVEDGAFEVWPALGLILTATFVAIELTRSHSLHQRMPDELVPILQVG